MAVKFKSVGDYKIGKDLPTEFVQMNIEFRCGFMMENIFYIDTRKHEQELVISVTFHVCDVLNRN